LFFTGCIAPGLAKSGILTGTTQALFGFLLLWRFIVGIGLGVEIITIDACISEMVPPP
jgi:MFS family permease